LSLYIKGLLRYTNFVFRSSACFLQCYFSIEDVKASGNVIYLLLVVANCKILVMNIYTLESWEYYFNSFPQVTTVSIWWCHIHDDHFQSEKSASKLTILKVSLSHPVWFIH